MFASAFAGQAVNSRCFMSCAPRRTCVIEAAHKKGAGSTKNGRDSKSKSRGVKVYGGQPVKAGGIIVRQLGTTVSVCCTRAQCVVLGACPAPPTTGGG